MRGVCWGILVLCFLAACVMDCRTHKVYNFIWWISGMAALVLLILREPEVTLLQWMTLIAFLSLQFRLFYGMYGKADTYAFCVCAMAETSLGWGMKGYLLHMLVSFLWLALIQGGRHNIAKTGNLKVPVPFLPYITLAFCTLLWYHIIC